MSNYSFNRIIIKYKDYEEYLEDYYPYWASKKSEKPFVTFSKVLGPEDEPWRIISAEGSLVLDCNNGYMDVRFQTRRFFPIVAAIKLLTLAPDTVWFMTEENYICVTRLGVENGEIVEDIYPHDVDDYDRFQCFHWGDETGEESEIERNMHPADDLIWYYFKGNEVWYRIKKRDLVDTYYSDYSITDFYDTTIDKKGDYAIIDDIIDYKHSLLGDYWQMKP